MGLFLYDFLNNEVEGELESLLSDLVALEPELIDSLVYTYIPTKIPLVTNY
jgi:hypothetical protein